MTFLGVSLQASMGFPAPHGHPRMKHPCEPGGTRFASPTSPLVVWVGGWGGAGFPLFSEETATWFLLEPTFYTVSKSTEGLPDLTHLFGLKGGSLVSIPDHGLYHFM